MSEPAINATIREFVRLRAERGDTVSTVLAEALVAFVEPFAATKEAQPFADQYRNDVAAMVAQAHLEFSPRSQP